MLNEQEICLQELEETYALLRQIILNPEADHKKLLLYLKWLKKKTYLVLNEETFRPEDLPELKRGMVILVDFGFNVGNEFGGIHPAIVLRNSSKNSPGVLVLPISSKKPKNIQDIHVEIGKIVGLKEYHWANIMHIIEVSKQRIIIPPEPKKVEGKVLNRISGAVVAQIALRSKNTKKR